MSFTAQEVLRAAGDAAPNRMVAVDLGLKDFVTDSRIGALSPYRARLHARVADARSNFLHHVSRALVNENQLIVIETLNVRGMIRNRRLARAITDAGWGELLPTRRSGPAGGTWRWMRGSQARSAAAPVMRFAKASRWPSGGGCARPAVHGTSATQTRRGIWRRKGCAG